jgi:hypothetical protein
MLRSMDARENVHVLNLNTRNTYFLFFITYYNCWV